MDIDMDIFVNWNFDLYTDDYADTSIDTDICIGIDLAIDLETIISLNMFIYVEILFKSLWVHK